MTATVLRPLTLADVDQSFELACEVHRDHLHPLDKACADLPLTRRRLRRRLRSDVAVGMGTLGAFRGSSACAFVVFGDGTRPVTGQQERHLLDVVAAPEALSLVPDLLRRVIADARAAGIDLLRTTVSAWGAGAAELDATFRKSGFVTFHLTMRRAVAARDPLPGARYGATQPEQRRFALECLQQAILNGLPGTDPGRVAAYAVRRYGRLQTPSRLSLVAEGDDGTPRAHALVELVPAKCRAGREAMLVDMFVPVQWRSEGWSARLWSYVESVLADRGIDRAEGTVGWLGTRDPQALVSRLQQDGWWVDRTSLELPLTAPIGVGA